MYIGVSGIDGSGKTTIINIINEYINHYFSLNTVVCDAMKQGCYNRELKKVDQLLDNQNTYDTFFSPEIVNLVFCADLYENYINIIQPKIHEGNVVISHRSRLCCRVYSEVFSEKLTLVDTLMQSVPFPDLLIYLKTSPEVALKRVYNREDKEGILVHRKENMDVFERASRLYDIQIQKSTANIITINGNMEIDNVEREVKEILVSYL